MKTDIEFYSSQGIITDPGPHASWLQSLPDEVPSLVRVIQGLLVHVFWLERYGLKLKEARKAEVQLRWVTKQLERIQELDPRPLTEARPPEKRLVGNCRDFTVLLVMMLRSKGIPARARCGFAKYFRSGRHEDHWVAEYWNADLQRWILVDAQLDDFQRKTLSIPFNPLDVPRVHFLTGGEAWLRCRTGQADPETFGIFDMKGLWFVRGDFIRDVAALNKVELLPWDAWGLADTPEKDVTPKDLVFLDELAELTRGDVERFEQVQGLYAADLRLRVPEVIKSYTQAGVQQVSIFPGS